jgi:TetR/AcrR family transcriptional repressor of uid operon
LSEPALLKEDEPLSERQAAIVDAAEKCFARAGFHRTTMQDVAAEAGMSPGNLYRYFPSKDALVAGLCERDRLGMAREFQDIAGAGEGFLAAFQALGRRHFQENAAGKAKLCLEIWAEATRKPEIAALQTEFDRAMNGYFVSAFEAAKAAGAIHPDTDSRAAASLIALLGDGLFVRRAVATDFDPEREIGEVFAVVKALLDGTVKLPKAAGDKS